MRSYGAHGNEMRPPRQPRQPDRHGVLIVEKDGEPGLDVAAVDGEEVEVVPLPLRVVDEAWFGAWRGRGASSDGVARRWLGGRDVQRTRVVFVGGAFFDILQEAEVVLCRRGPAVPDLFEHVEVQGVEERSADGRPQ